MLYIKQFYPLIKTIFIDGLKNIIRIEIFGYETLILVFILLALQINILKTEASN